MDQRPADSHDAGDLRERLLRSRLFQGIPGPLVATVVAGSETRELAPGEALLLAGTENSVLYVVLSGLVSIHVPGADEAHTRLGAGECVGELSLVDGQRVSADVITDEPTLVLGFSREQLWSLIDSSPEAARNLLRILAGRIRADDAVLGESSRQKRHLEHLAMVDGLTGLRNRRWLDEAFARQLARAVRAGQTLSLLMADIDHFKGLNDTHGHPFGDTVLQRVARTLADGLRPQDLLARYGGEEFAVLLPGIEVQNAVAIAERLRRAVEAETGPAGAVGEHASRVTVSIGVAALQDQDTLPSLLGRADEALYRAKASGRNRVHS